MLRLRGFTLVELAVALLIVGFLLVGAVVTLQGHMELRNHEESQRRLNAGVESVLSFALINRRLPCPARYVDASTHSSGQESFCTSSTQYPCTGHTTTVQAHGNCSVYYTGFLPAATVGAGPVDAQGFAIDAWGNRLRYVVSRLNSGCTATPPADTRILTSQGNLKTYGIGCLPNDLDVCTSYACTTRVVSQNTAVFIVYSTGKNGVLPADPSLRPNEYKNLDSDAIFVSRTPDPAGAAGGEFDDMLVTVPVGVLYSRLLAAGIFP